MIRAVLRRLALAAVGATAITVACGDPRPPDNLITEARVLAIRIEVVEEGPNSVGILPVPADRVRASGLPGDTLRANALIVDPTGVRDPADFDLRFDESGDISGAFTRTRTRDDGV